MNRYRKLHKHLSTMVLVCFFTAITSISAFAGHDCCGKCVESLSQPSMLATTEMVSSDCCAVNTECACTFQPENNQARQVYSVSHVNAAGDDLLADLTDAVSEKDTDNDSRQAAIQTPLSELRIRSGPIYLTNQSFLC